MPLHIEDRVIERVQIVDDNREAREGYSFSVEDLSLIPISADGPQYTDLDQFIEMIRLQAHAAICDYHLSKANYASFDGGNAVAQLYQRQFPAILCTSYYNSDIDSIRRYRQHIPILLKPQDLGPETIEAGFRQCIAEFKGRVPASRKAWRSLIRVEDVDLGKGYFYVVVPSWNPHETISLRFMDVPQDIRSRIQNGQQRFHAQVNVGAENYEDLYFMDWEQA